MRQIIERRETDGYECFRIPGIVRTGRGALLLYCECRKPAEDAPDSDWAPIDIGLRRSTDGGKTWSARQILVEGRGKTVNNPVMFSGEEEVLLLWQEEYRRTFLLRSSDDGLTWGGLRELTAFTKTPEYDYTVIACGPGHGTVLRSGRYVVPVWMCENHADPKAHHPSILSTLYSDDRGAAWQLGELIVTKELKDPSECALAQLADDRVLLSIRHENETRLRMLAVSADGAGPWEDLHYAPELKDPICEGGMVSQGEAVYFSHCGHTSLRRDLTLHRSVDGGASWGKGLLLDELAGYSDLALSADGRQLYVFYERTDKGPKGQYVKELAFDVVQTADIP